MTQSNQSLRKTKAELQAEAECVAARLIIDMSARTKAELESFLSTYDPFETLRQPNEAGKCSCPLCLAFPEYAVAKGPFDE